MISLLRFTSLIFILYDRVSPLSSYESLIISLLTFMKVFLFAATTTLLGFQLQGSMTDCFEI